MKERGRDDIEEVWKGKKKGKGGNQHFKHQKRNREGEK